MVFKCFQFAQSKRSSFDFYWIPVTLTIRLYQKELLIIEKWKWQFHFAIQWFYHCFFYGLQKHCEFSKGGNFHFCQTFISLIIHSDYNPLLMNLEIKVGISLYDFLLKLNSCNFCSNFCWSDKYKKCQLPVSFISLFELVIFWSRTCKISMKITAPHLSCVLSEVSWQSIMGHCKVEIFKSIRKSLLKCNVCYIYKALRTTKTRRLRV